MFNFLAHFDIPVLHQQQELVTTKKKIIEAITARQLSLGEFYVRKLLELYLIGPRSVMTIDVGRGDCGNPALARYSVANKRVISISRG